MNSIETADTALNLAIVTPRDASSFPEDGHNSRLERALRRCCRVLSRLALAAALGTTLGFGGGARAEETVPLPSDCAAPPISADELQELLDSAASSPTSVEIMSPTSIPTGVPVEEETAREIRDSVHSFVACTNAGISLTSLRLMSDRFLTQPGTSLAPLETPLATPEPPEHLVAILGVWNIERLADGRVAATVATNQSAPNGDVGRTRVFIFVQDQTDWLLDEFITGIVVNGELTSTEDLLGTPPAVPAE